MAKKYTDLDRGFFLGVLAALRFVEHAGEQTLADEIIEGCDYTGLHEFAKRENDLEKTGLARYWRTYLKKSGGGAGEKHA